MMSSIFMPSASALKFGITRCRKTGRAISFMSSISAAGRPFRIARAFAPRIKNWVARGPAPHSTHSLTKLYAFLIGLVPLTKSTAYSTTFSAIGTLNTKF